MRIAFLLPVNGISGGMFVVYQHAHYLASRGHEVVVIFQTDVRGVEVTYYPNFSLPTRSLAAAAASGARFDVVISGWWECCYSMFRIPADRYAHLVQGDDRECMRQGNAGADVESTLPFIDWAFSSPSIGYITVANWLKRQLEGEDDVVVECALNGIDTSMFHPSVKPLAPRGGPKVRVLIEGSQLRFKRIDLAFRVAGRVPNIEIWHVTSDGVVDPRWRCDRRFCEVPYREMPAIYASCDILLKLSVLEGFFGPPLEMMACGGTAVVGRVRGHEEYVVDGHNALVVDLDDEEAAYRSLRRLVEDGELRRRLSEHGIGTARALDWSTRAPMFEAALESLLRRLPPTPRSVRAQYLIMDALLEQLRMRHGDQIALLRRDVAELRAALFGWRPFCLWHALRRRVRRGQRMILRMPALARQLMMAPLRGWRSKAPVP